MLLISIALVGLLDAYRVSIEAHRAINHRAIIRLLLQRKVFEIEKANAFSKGQEEGTFEDQPQCQWSVLTTESGLASLFRLQVTVKGYGEALSIVLFAKQSSAGTQDANSNPAQTTGWGQEQAVGKGQKGA